MECMIGTPNSGTSSGLLWGGVAAPQLLIGLRLTGMMRSFTSLSNAETLSAALRHRRYSEQQKKNILKQCLIRHV
jgi:hypothetical protein